MFGRTKFELLDDEQVFLNSLPDTMQHVLAIGRGPSTSMIALREVCCVRQGADWEVFGWHEVQNGRWDGETNRMIWVLSTGDSASVELTEPGELPRVFTERVNESIVVQRVLRVPDTSFTVIIVARRPLRADAQLIWTVQALGSTRLTDPRVEQFVVEATEHLTEEFEPTELHRRALFAL